MGEVRIRNIQEEDVQGVIDLYRAVYGDDFPFREFYDAGWVKRGVFSSEIIWIVAEREDRRLLGSAAVLLNAADRDDLVGEFGRLVVHPDARSLDLGTRLVQAQIDYSQSFIEYAFAECRTAHVGAQKICTRLGFGVTGFEPHAYQFGPSRESVVYVSRLLGNARRLRKNNPRVIPEVHAIGSLALQNCGLDDDLIVEQGVDPYPVSDSREYELADLQDTQVYRLLRLDSNRAGGSLVFGSMRLEYGFLRLKAHDARYTVLQRGRSLAGGIGYTWDEMDRKVRLFELIAVDDLARGTLLEHGLAQLERLYDPAYVAIDVSAHAPRLQQTLALLGFSAVAYAPSMVYEAGERLDVVKMAKLRMPLRVEQAQLIDPAREAMHRVAQSVAEKARGVSVEAVARRVKIFDGLTDLQYGRVREICREVPYEAGEPVVVRGSTDRSLFIILGGAVEIRLDGGPGHVATIGPGEVFGELALIDGLPRSATAVCGQRARLIQITQEDFHALTRRDPALGMVIYRNLARSVGQRLREANLRFEERLATLKSQLSDEGQSAAGGGR